MRRDEFVDQKFTWFTGVIEDINDPETLNRVKVRPFGYYTEDDKVLPTSELPWSQVMMPTTSASLKGNGSSHQLEVGSWVVGFFRDGPSAQDAMVMGTISSKTDGEIDVPKEHSTTRKVYKSKAGHLVEIENNKGSESVKITHGTNSNSYILFDSVGNIHVSAPTIFLNGEPN